jgi:FMN phosphatase YigB (HAD superfamily)
MQIQDGIGRKRLTVFDLDGTLLDYKAEEHSASLNICRMLASRCERSCDEVLATYTNSKKAGRKLPAAEDQLGFRFRRLCAELGIDPLEAAALKRSYVEWRLAACRVLAGALVMIDAFANQSDQMAVLTNGDDDLQKARIAAAGLDKHFARVYSSQRIGYAKPEPMAFAFVQTDLGLAPPEWRMVGDNPEVDLVVPKQLGIETWQVEPQTEIVKRW